MLLSVGVQLKYSVTESQGCISITTNKQDVTYNQGVLLGGAQTVCRYYYYKILLERPLITLYTGQP